MGRSALMLCLDTYALIEVHNGSAAYASILQEEIAITELTLAEFYGVLYRKLGEKTAEHWIAKLSPYCAHVDLRLLFKAAKYKEDHKKENLSYVDCVGYIYARSNGLRFVTGDKEFQSKVGVLYLK
jgi:predicted nucleic acid-binding protein